MLWFITYETTNSRNFLTWVKTKIFGNNPTAWQRWLVNIGKKCWLTTRYTVYFSVIGLLLVGIFVVLFILIFKDVENWSTTESTYFTVVTMTTIGFGDLGTPKSEHFLTPEYKTYFRTNISKGISTRGRRRWIPYTPFWLQWKYFDYL